MPWLHNQVILTALCLCLAALAPWSSAPADRGVPAEATRTQAIGGDFTLTDHNGAPFSLSDERGKVVLMFFGYTSCPDVCPTTLMMVKQVIDRLGDRARDLTPLFISVDPQRDTPSRLKAYVSYFDPSIIAATGTQDQLHALTRSYGTFYRYTGDIASNDYAVDHGANLYVIDRHGELARIIPFGTPVDTIASIVSQVEAGKP